MTYIMFSVADTSLLVAQITVVIEIPFRVVVVTSSVVKIIFVVV